MNYTVNIKQLKHLRKEKKPDWIKIFDGNIKLELNFKKMLYKFHKLTYFVLNLLCEQ